MHKSRCNADFDRQDSPRRRPRQVADVVIRLGAKEVLRALRRPDLPGATAAAKRVRAALGDAGGAEAVPAAAVECRGPSQPTGQS